VLRIALVAAVVPLAAGGGGAVVPHGNDTPGVAV
jgi:hypothetical protein